MNSLRNHAQFFLEKQKRRVRKKLKEEAGPRPTLVEAPAPKVYTPLRTSVVGARAVHYPPATYAKAVQSKAGPPELGQQQKRKLAQEPPGRACAWSWDGGAGTGKPPCLHLLPKMARVQPAPPTLTP